MPKIAISKGQMVYLSMSNSTVFFPKLGILGGGQLGRMMIQETINWNIHVSVLDPNVNCPCSTVANSLIIGDFRDFEAVLGFGRTVDILTIEIEQVNIEALKQLVSEGKEVYPQPEVLEMIKDKGLQKEFYRTKGISSPDFILIENKADLLGIDESWFPCFQKARKDGYDGKGVMYLESKDRIESAFDVPSVIEKPVQLKCEFALIAVGDGKGACSIFPPVVMEFQQDENLVEFLVMPGELPDYAAKEAEMIVRRIISDTQIRGLLAVEFFLDLSGRVLVNEIAPRPHNSGHTTIEGNYSSQFAEHIRAVIGWPGGSLETRKIAVMINLLGEPGYEGTVYYDGMEKVLSMPEVYIHLYGKTLTKPYRKMGHVTILDVTVERARERAEIVKSILRVISK
jgi:5-(carboxyamino)imidazole ribonucleotide synthase